VVAADARPMGIEWAETAVWSVGKTVRTSESLADETARSIT